jgi:hypothetical protein
MLVALGQSEGACALYETQNAERQGHQVHGGEGKPQHG